MPHPKVERPHDTPQEHFTEPAWFEQNDNLHGRLRDAIDPRKEPPNATTRAILLLQTIRHREELLPHKPQGLFDRFRGVFGNNQQRQRDAEGRSLDPIVQTLQRSLTQHLPDPRPQGIVDASIQKQNEEKLQQIRGQEQLEGQPLSDAALTQARLLTLALVGDYQQPTELVSFLKREGLQNHPEYLVQLHSLAHRTILRCRRIQDANNNTHFMAFINRLRNFCELLEDFAPKGTKFEERYGH